MLNFNPGRAPISMKSSFLQKEQMVDTVLAQELICLVKVYTVGPEYAHAEARKSPVVDGKVMVSFLLPFT